MKKFLIYLILYRNMKRVLVGKLIDPSNLSRGRFTKKRVRKVYSNTWLNLARILETTDFKVYETRGNRLMVFLVACSASCYQGFRDEQIPADWAKQLFSEIGWSVYTALSMPFIILAKIRHRTPQKQLNAFIKMLCLFPFSQDKNGYQYKFWEEDQRLCTDWFQCAPCNFIKSLNNSDYLEMFKESWCQYDFALPQLDNEKGFYERTKTLSHGDDVCNMRWYADHKVLNDKK
ncbi:hypothetical protein OAT67_02185 [Bacteriovoracaceae bacterium]|nr:hypothetical protein [Bacteriovoracaceae bacterium]